MATDADLPVADEAQLASSVAYQRSGAAPAAEYVPREDHDDGHDLHNQRLLGADHAEVTERVFRRFGGGVG